MYLNDGNGTFVRRDVWTLRANDPWDPITEAYARAVAVMQARPLEDPTSWVYQAAIHGSYLPMPPGARWNECQHGSWYFLSWHRMYLYHFERIVRAAVRSVGGPADFALPYWNYDQPFPINTLPLPFREPALPDGSPNPLYLPSPFRSTDIANGFQLPPQATSSSAAMARTNFAAPPRPGFPSFGGGRQDPAHFSGNAGSLEITPHNVIHVQIGGFASGPCQGGFMIDPNCAALDPIFWLHHANIDRLWNQWLALEGGRANPSEAAWLDQPFTFYDEAGAAVTMTGAEVVDSAAQLRYVYDDQDQPLADSMSATPAGTPASSEPPEMAAATEQPIELVGTAVSVELTVPPSTRSLVSGEDIAAGARAVYLNVEDIEAKRNPGIVYGVFVNLPSDDPEVDRGRHHVGNIALFGIELMNDPDRAHGGVPGFRHTFDITGLVAALSEAGTWDPSAITVTFEPIMPTPPPGQEARMAVLSAERARAAAAIPVRVGRVSLFVA